MSFLHNIRLLLLAGWLGAAIFFSAVVAPGSFRTLRTFDLPNQSEIAGGLVSYTLTFINFTGVIVSAIVFVATLALKSMLSRQLFRFQLIPVMIMALATGVGGWVIGAQMRALRSTFSVPIDQLPPDDAGRIAFAALHGYSVIALSVAMIAALIAFCVMAKRAPIGRE